MFIFRLSSWVDKFDPYWYSRFLGLKVSYLAIILFLANALLQPPIAPSFIMIVAISGILLIESPTINSFKKKDNVYLAYTVLVLLTIAIFSLNVYLKTWFILVAFAWCYILYSLLKKAPAMFPVVSLVLMLGLMSLEGPYTPANPYIVLNQILYFGEFAIIVFWAHKCFPNMYLYVWKSALLRCLENYQTSLNSGNEFNHKLATKYYLALTTVLPLLTAKREIYALVRCSNLINEFNYFIADICHPSNSEAVATSMKVKNSPKAKNVNLQDILLDHISSSDETAALRKIVIGQLQELYQGIVKNKRVVLPMSELRGSSDSAMNMEFGRNILQQLALNWNKICANN